MTVRIHHFRDPHAHKPDTAFCGEPIRKLSFEPDPSPATICPVCDERFKEHRKRGSGMKSGSSPRIRREQP